MNRRFAPLVALVLALGLGGSGCAHGGRRSHSGAFPLLILGGVVVGSALIVAYGGGDECTDPAGRCGGPMSFPPPPDHQTP